MQTVTNIFISVRKRLFEQKTSYCGREACKFLLNKFKTRSTLKKEKDILEIINQALPTISVVANSAVILKLTESVGCVLKTLYEPRLKFRNGKVDIELKELEKNTTTL